MYSNTRLRSKYGSKKQAAKRSGKQSTLTVNQYVALFKTTPCCHYTGAEFVHPPVGQHHQKEPTLERVDPDVGYVPSNVVLVTREANAVKEHVVECAHGTLSTLEFINLALSIVNNERLCEYMDQRPRSKQQCKNK